ncbi:alkylhydroperoxidase like protein, AhpD family [Paenibacillus curdlanolyticus YK9]|uniref:Alkylhydroperoxidase like protein, AhpD family n=1 Tax=Paenibacillus curdlanolyticus YK9 TaxID=717606 RepID=E0IFV6_9BACL|nr:carboxymuconolactone decarboxylase family protein [Paenibacillus curdlanolyticus]EFM08536.1 alkylhydroperoxidase like protein, AhpD family [Paenibacillus curdlanolyticus YK9]
MKMRMDHRTANPAGFQAMLKLEEAASKMGLDPLLYELVKIRASQINGCSFCLDMHVTDTRNLGETEQRLSLIVVWREAPVFTQKERAALALTEAVTRISDAGVPQELYDEVREHFSESEIVALIMAVNAINSWNRLAVTTGMFPGCYNS